MEASGDPEDMKMLVRILRLLREWDQAELAAAAGVDVSSISHYETGRTVPPRRTLERLATGVGLPMSFVEGSLLPVVSAARVLASPLGGAGGDEVEESAAALGRALAAAGRSTLTAFLALRGSVDAPEE